MTTSARIAVTPVQMVTILATTCIIYFLSQKHHAAAMPSTSDATLQSASPFHPVLQQQLVLLIRGERRYHARFFFRLAAVWYYAYCVPSPA